MVKNRKHYDGRGGILFQVSVVLVISIIAGLCFNVYKGRISLMFTAYTPPPSQFESIDIETLKVLIDQDMAVIVDARERDDFQMGHIKGALNLPIKEFSELYESIVASLPEGKTIVVYCSSETCTDSEKLAEFLKQKKHTDIMVYKGGYAEWQEHQAMSGGEDVYEPEN